MQFIKLLSPKTDNVYVTSVQEELSEACHNIPTMQINLVRDVNIASIINQPFANETEALNAALELANNTPTVGAKWFHSLVGNKYITRLLTDGGTYCYGPSDYAVEKRLHAIVFNRRIRYFGT